MSARLLVAIALLICAYLAAGLPLHGAGIVATAVLAMIDVALVQATGGLAFARGGSLDERQLAARDLAFRRSFRLLGGALVACLVLGYVGVIVGFFTASTAGRLSMIDFGIGARYVVAVLELVVMMPTFLIAWGERWRLAVTPLLAAPLIVAAWLVTVAWAPAQAAPPSHDNSGDPMMRGAECRDFAGGRVIGAQFGATVGMHAAVCWDGRSAFLSPDRMSYGADTSEDFAAVSNVAATATTDGDGTLHYVFRARVTPLPFPIAARDVQLRLTVTRDGRVLEQP